MKTKIVLLPLDERPCNYEFPMKLFSHDKVEIVRPKKLGNKKTPASFETIVEFLREECKDASGLVVSMDMLFIWRADPIKASPRRERNSVREN